MDRRKRTGVALAAGLLFLFVTEILLLFLAGNSLYKEEQGKLGALVLSHPEQETEYIELFDRGKQRNRQEEEAGKELEERYGYTPFDGRSVKTFAAYGIGMAMVFVAGLGVSWGLFLRNKRDRQQDENNQEELREKYIELQNHFEKVREKLSREENNTKSLITDISHQLKTPIASLKMSCELAGSADLTWEEREEFYKKEWDEIQRLENLLDSLIHVSRLESGMIQIQPEMGSLKNTLVQAVNSVYMKAYEKSIDISLDEFQDVQIVHDSKWTGEVFVNILDNAVKYSPEHTEIRIRVTELATCMMLEFIDQGTGIPAEEAHRVFQRFYRGNQEYVKKQEGSGVGLYLARKILEEQKGTICVLVKYYGKGDNLVKAIDHTDLIIEPGEFTAIVGRSGSGKSTLLHMLGGLDRPDSGKVLIEGRDIFQLKDEKLAVFRRRKIGFIFQSYNLVPSLNVWENIVLPIGLDGKKVDTEYVMDIICRIGMEDKLKSLPNTLSGGQQQRVAIARALASRPAIILADEPTGNLDSKTELEVISMLKSCVSEYGQTLVMITHDETIAQMADRMIVIEDGKVVRA